MHRLLALLSRCAPWSLLKTTPGILAAGCFLAAISVSPMAHAQRTSENANAEQFDVANLIDTMLAKIASGEFGPDHPATRFNKAILDTHARYHEAIAAEHLERLNFLEQRHEKTMQDILESEADNNPENVPMNVETSELLLRECLLEWQRLEWDAAALPVLANSKLAEHEEHIRELRLSQAEKALDLLRQKLDIATQGFKEAEALFKKGVFPNSELNEQRLRVAAIESEMSEKQIEFETNAEQAKLDQDSEIQKTAEQVSSLERRRAVLKKQMEQLKAQRIRARKTELLLSKLDMENEAKESLSHEIARRHLLATEVRTLFKLLDEPQKPKASTDQ